MVREDLHPLIMPGRKGEKMGDSTFYLWTREDDAWEGSEGEKEGGERGWRTLSKSSFVKKENAFFRFSVWCRNAQKRKEREGGK